MTLQLNVTPETEAKRKERAAAEGKDLAAFMQQAINELANEGSVTKPRVKLSPAEQWDYLKDWMEKTAEIVANSLPPGTFVDDSRESIYAGRGE
jgi:hypothetical protein